MSTQQGRVLVTGLNSFTGHHLAVALGRAGYEVHGTVRTGEPIGPERHVAELNDRAALLEAIETVRPRHVIHLAAVSFVAHNDVEDIYRTNIVGSRNLLSALASSSIASTLGTVLLASSANIYGNTEVTLINEDQPPHPANDYAISKAAMEQMAALWSDRLPITVVRPFNYTGVGQSLQFLIPKIVNAFAQRSPKLELGNLDVYRDFSDVRDVVEVYTRLLMLSPRTTLNVCSEQVHTLREILAMASHLSGHSLDIEVNPQFVRANEVRVLRGSAARLRKFMPDWQPRPLSNTLAWMLDSAQLHSSTQPTP
ncbi:GDP-mannose 4,6-dehydratase [Comamonas sp. 17RB]|uniref:GDP-mannose 4,6-dehydratase n=1 Tax=Comamonas sp. 17RB TaxID=3047025 RepID=UPI0024B7EACA|nr:GDP-mannose 4,6-dehydratase [Comamonas sp. 17RB]MDI9856778.1 GDP-mannose 4,6-dehydratase [Comamonas sp. 17RB]